MRIGVGQINTKPGDLAATIDRMVAYSERAMGHGVDLLVFPMAALTGPFPLAEGQRDDFLLDTFDALADAATRLACPAIVPIVSDIEGDTLPEAMLLKDGAIAPLKLTAYAANVGDADSVPSPGDPSPDLPEFDVCGLRFGLAFTYDDLDDYASFDFGLDVLLFVSGYGYAADDSSSALGGALTDNRFVGDARTTGAWLIGAGSLGGYGTQVYTGSSFALSPEGALVASAPAFEEDLMVVDVTPCACATEGDAHTAENDAPSLADVSALEQSKLTPEVYNRPLYLWQALVLGLRDFVNKQGGRQVSLVIDGTLSSMVTAALATDAFGPSNVHAIVDCPGDLEREAACQRLAINLRLDARSASDIPRLPRADTPADELLRRGIVEAYLAATSQSLGATPLSTLDKTELAIGRSHLAPMAAQFMPLGDVYRSAVVDLARMRNAMSPVFPTVSLSSREVPTIGRLLRDGYSDESWVRAIDAVLQDHVEWSHSLTDIVHEDVHERSLVEGVIAAYERGEARRLGRGLCLMVSTTTLYDARRPLTLAWHDHVRQGSDPQADSIESVLERLTESIGARGDGQQGQEEAEQSGLEMRRTLSFLRDFAVGGAFGPRHPEPDSFAGRAMGPDAASGDDSGVARFRDSAGNEWPTPFSEN